MRVLAWQPEPVPVHRLALVETDRIVDTTVGTKAARSFLDFAVDDVPLYPILRNEEPMVRNEGLDVISALWLGVGPWAPASVEAVMRLLGESESDAPQGRVCVYICAECGDLGCGAVTMRLDVDADLVVWRDWAHQTDYSDDLDPIDALFDMTFERAEYERTLRQALVRLGRS